MKPLVIFVVGPTAAGKTETAVYVARSVNGEIISCDSMQIYKGMDILTSKPPAALLKKVPHHCIGFFSPKKEYNASLYFKRARSLAGQIIKRGKVPVFTGGTGMYMTVMLDGIFLARTEDMALREKLYAEAKESGSLALHRRLEKIDPSAAAKIHPNDLRRMVRAIEVFETTGKPISEHQQQRTGLAAEFNTRIFCLNMPRELLYARIVARVEKMFRRGLVKEVRNIQAECRLSKTASSAIGIKEVQGYLKGEYSLQEAISMMQQNTRRYAKRQLTWFRKDKRLEWIDIGDKDRPKDIAGRIQLALNR